MTKSIDKGRQSLKSSSRLSWSDLTFPPINLWTVPWARSAGDTKERACIRPKCNPSCKRGCYSKNKRDTII